MNKKLWVLAEPDTFFLPRLLARLAAEGRLAGIIEVTFPSSFKRKWHNGGRLLAAIGVRTAVVSILCVVVSKVLDALSPGYFYSLRKVAGFYGLPFVRCCGFSDPSLQDILQKRIGDGPVFVQVSRLVPGWLVNRYYLINKHCSLLPRFGGVYPVFWSLLAGDTRQGVTVHRMNEKFDEGPILGQARIAVRKSDNVFSIYERLYNATYEVMKTLMDRSQDWYKGGSVTELSTKSYFSFPTSKDRLRFVRQGGKFGCPLRLSGVEPDLSMEIRLE